MKEIQSKEFLDINDPNLDLKALLEKVRFAGRLLVRDGSDFFSIEKSIVKVSGNARDFLTAGGPISDDEVSK